MDRTLASEAGNARSIRAENTKNRQVACFCILDFYSIFGSVDLREYVCFVTTCP